MSCGIKVLACCFIGHRWTETVRVQWVYARAKRKGGPIPCGVEDVSFECERCGSEKDERQFRSKTARRRFERAHS